MLPFLHLGTGHLIYAARRGYEAIQRQNGWCLFKSILTWVDIWFQISILNCSNEHLEVAYLVMQLNLSSIYNVKFEASMGEMICYE